MRKSWFADLPCSSQKQIKHIKNHFMMSKVLQVLHVTGVYNKIYLKEDQRRAVIRSAASILPEKGEEEEQVQGRRRA